MKRTIVLLVFALTALAVSADEPITKPIRTTWIATSCSTWNCAAAALILANGDKYVLILPTGRDEKPWIVLRRVEEGAIFVPDEEPSRAACSKMPTPPRSSWAAWTSAAHR